MPSSRFVLKQAGLRGPAGPTGPPGSGGGGGGGNVAVDTHAATSKGTPVNADEIPLVDSASGNALAKLTWQNLITRVKAAFSKSDVGLGNVDNTSDVNKPVSTAQQTALDTKVNTSGLQATIDGVFPGLEVAYLYNTGSSAWPTVPTAIGTDANLSIKFVGGDVAHAPPSVSATVRTWVRPT